MVTVTPEIKDSLQNGSNKEGTVEKTVSTEELSMLQPWFTYVLFSVNTV